MEVDRTLPIIDDEMLMSDVLGIRRTYIGRPTTTNVFVLMVIRYHSVRIWRMKFGI